MITRPQRRMGNGTVTEVLCLVGQAFLPAVLQRQARMPAPPNQSIPHKGLKWNPDVLRGRLFPITNLRPPISHHNAGTLTFADRRPEHPHRQADSSVRPARGVRRSVALEESVATPLHH